MELTEENDGQKKKQKKKKAKSCTVPASQQGPGCQKFLNDVLAQGSAAGPKKFTYIEETHGLLNLEPVEREILQIKSTRHLVFVSARSQIEWIA